MTCARPDCKRPASIGVHCRKCRQRFMVIRHNAERTAALTGSWPCYDGSNLDDLIDELLAAL